MLSFLRRLGAIHDFVTALGFGAAALCVAVIAASFCYEVVSRYFFNAPTDWAAPLVTYSLGAMIFLAMPELTRRAGHVKITILLDLLTGTSARILQIAIRAIGASACFFAAWFTGDATVEQFNQGVWTNPPLAVAKWMISGFIPYGFSSAAIYFLRQGANR